MVWNPMPHHKTSLIFKTNAYNGLDLTHVFFITYYKILLNNK